MTFVSAFGAVALICATAGFGRGVGSRVRDLHFAVALVAADHILDLQGARRRVHLSEPERLADPRRIDGVLRGQHHEHENDRGSDDGGGDALQQFLAGGRIDFEGADGRRHVVLVTS